MPPAIAERASNLCLQLHCYAAHQGELDGRLDGYVLLSLANLLSLWLQCITYLPLPRRSS